MIINEPDFGIKLSDQNGLWLDCPAGFWTIILCLQAQIFTEINFCQIGRSLFIQSSGNASPAQPNLYFQTNKLHGLNSYRVAISMCLCECLRKSICLNVMLSLFHFCFIGLSLIPPCCANHSAQREQKHSPLDTEIRQQTLLSFSPSIKHTKTHCKKTGFFN